jgi:hypothetical protein
MKITDIVFLFHALFVTFIIAGILTFAFLVIEVLNGSLPVETKVKPKPPETELPPLLLVSPLWPLPGP